MRGNGKTACGENRRRRNSDNRGINMAKQRKRKKNNSQKKNTAKNAAQVQQTRQNSMKFPRLFPFWARFKPNKGRTTLIIDEVQVGRNNSDQVDDYFVHREAIHCLEDNRYVLSGDYEKIDPNPDRDDPRPMYLKRPHKHPKRVFEPHNKNLTMPEDLRQRYDKNNHKKENPGEDAEDKRT